MSAKEIERIPYVVAFEEQAGFKDTYAGQMNLVTLEGQLIKAKGSQAKTIVIFMHPSGFGAYLPMSAALAQRGVDVVWCRSRYRGVDSALIMEKVAVDLGACVRDAKERMGYQTVLLGGWSGGGSLSMFYQAEAEDPTLTSTPAGEGPDLTEQNFIPADGIMMIAAHLSRHKTMTEFMDPSILDEADPTSRDLELDLYNPANPNQPSYDAAFVERFREAQIARNRRITAWAKAKLESLRRDGLMNEEFAFVVHGTMADPRFLDPTIEPNDREPGVCFLGDPKTVNNGPVGLARFTTLRSWLSQWSYDDARADGEDNAARITIPALVIGNTADDACMPSHATRLYAAIGHDNKEFHWIKGANHYYFGQEAQLNESADLCRAWMDKHDFIT